MPTFLDGVKSFFQDVMIDAFYPLCSVEGSKKGENALNDDELMRLIKKDDHTAFLYARWARRVMSFAYRALNDRREAEDVVQETFMSLFSSRERYEERGKFPSFLFRIAGNAVRDRYRSRKGIPVEDAGSFITEPCHQDDPHIRIDLEEALKKLSFEHREVLLLAVTGGLTYREISEITGISESAVAQRICRTRKKLQEIMSLPSEV
jgi:RNA polymerase sigma-70 factor (ECF subfamily)